MSEKQEKLQEIERRLVILLSELNALELTFSKLKNEAIELYMKVNNELDIKENPNGLRS